ncbi:hypothetical protein [Croceicoccus marinus]|uniref:hypothetical protein n=1 Tax=Croceicoccus marinus TaxID=450378 RepID=UPI000B18ECDA|nr:hypothetical protein [Croceicoccus marinus]
MNMRKEEIYAAELRSYHDWLINADALELSMEGAMSAWVRKSRLDFLDRCTNPFREAVRCTDTVPVMRESLNLRQFLAS